jgi:hypothetical protein
MREHCEEDRILQRYQCDFSSVHLSGRKKGGMEAVKIIKSL